MLLQQMVDKLIIADIAPKFYPQHQSILGGLNAVDFQRNQADLKWKKSLLLTYQMWEPVLMKSLYWEEPGN
jgi:hypothetical protein